MSTSVHEGIIRRGIALEATSALGASVVRDYVFNNLLHMADEFGQVRMAMSSSSYLAPPEAWEEDIYYLLASSGEFPIPMRQDGTPYAIRIRIGGANGDAGTTTFRVVLSPKGLANSYANADTFSGSAFDFVWDATCSSTSVAYLTGTSRGLAASSNMLTVLPEIAAGWMRNSTTLTDLDGAPATVNQCMVAVHVFAMSQNLSVEPHLYAAYAAEYVGAPT